MNVSQENIIWKNKMMDWEEKKEEVEEVEEKEKNGGGGERGETTWKWSGE